MLWPSFSDYEFFIKNAFDFSVLDPVLRNGTPMKGISGGFSRVYPVRVASKTFALRCWVKDVGNAKNRYEKISTYLKQRRLQYFVDFEYVSEGVLINNTKYPITRMEWADGVSLRKFIEQNSQDPHVFKVIADEFRKMVATLHDHKISHGDLQDGNILIKRNGAAIEIKLIDYDSLSVPALHGQAEQIVGLPEYQHPQRIAGGGKASEKVDYFSELVIYLSFLSLSEKPDLWTQFGDEKRVDRGLLFSKKDFENPDQSDVFQQLANLSPDVQQLTATLKDFCAKTSIDQLKPLEAILPKRDANPLSIINLWQYIVGALKGSWHSVTTGALGLGLFICFIAFLIQMNAKDVSLSQNAVLTKRIAQRELEIQALENTNEEFNRVNGELQKELTSKNSMINTTSGNMASLQRQLNEQKNKNRTLQNQVVQKNTEIRRLRNDNAVALRKNRTLRNQIDEGKSGVVDQNATIQRLRNEKTETLAGNQKLQDQNQNLIRQNQKLREEKRSLQSQLIIAKQNGSGKESGDDRSIDPVLPEPLKQIDEYRDEVPLATVKYTNHGIEAFKLKDYDNAVDFFRDAVQVDLTFAITHYNLGCVYLEMREYSKAINAFSEAVDVDHKFKEAYYNLGLAHLGKGAHKQAKSSIELALRIDKDYQSAHTLLGAIEKSQR
ncbi:MAG: tetratricopeptide repeat protein [Candidatus Poribacteria bacterium]|nr:tetratricopeptide repeat protein [Candidatus Poribacteria bacterium]